MDEEHLSSSVVRPAWTASVSSWLATSLLAAVAALTLPCVLSLLAVVWLGSNLSLLIMAVCGVIWPLAVLALFWPSTLTVGADGVALRWLWKHQWVGWNDVVDVKHRGNEVHLVTRDGRTLVIPVRRAFGTADQGVSLGAELFVRACAEMQRRVTPIPAVQPLERPPGLSVDEWIQSLRAVGQGAAVHFRQIALSHDLLRETLENRAVPEAVRAAAAVALAGLGARDDVKVRAESVASPKLRAVMTAAADDDHEALVEAMREVEVNEQRRGGSNS